MGVLSLLAVVWTASAGDLALYERALRTIEEHALNPDAVDPPLMFEDAGQSLASRIEWLVVRWDGSKLQLADGAGRWSAAVPLALDADVGALAAALDQVEDQVRAAGLPIDPQVDLRVELLRGVVKSLDRHSTVLHADGLDRFDERLSGTLSGVGMTVSARDNRLVVSELVPDSPAERGGVKPGDVIQRIDGVATVGMTVSDSSSRIRGPAGSTVVLTVQRGPSTLDLTLVREQVKLRNVESSVADNGVGVVTIEHFSELTHDFLAQSLRELDQRGALRGGLVIDLRGNTGGSLLQSADAADSFLSSGIIVTTVGADGAPVPGLVPRIDAHADDPTWGVPLVVLMDHQTASGSEILAGALARLDRAVLVGTTSFGKGTVQKVYQIAPDIKLKLTVAEYRVRGKDRIAGVGLAPDLAFAPVHFGEDGAWWPDPSRERLRLASGTRLVYYAVEEAGWRPSGAPPPDRDAVLSSASQVVASAEGGSRKDLLDAASFVGRRVAEAEDQALVATFAARGIDWSPAPPDTVQPEPRVSVRLEPRALPTAGERVELGVSVKNTGSAPLYRAAVRLRSVNGLWDDRVFPLGRVRPGGSAVGAVFVDVPGDMPTRTDEIELLLEADGVPTRPIALHTLAVQGAPPPLVAATVRAVPRGDHLAVQVELENRGETTLEGLRVHLPFPDLDGVELVLADALPGPLGPKERRIVELELKLGPRWTASTVPVHLKLSAAGRGTLADWPVELARAGGFTRLEPPRVEMAPFALVQAPGQAELVLSLSDDHALDHLVVTGGVVTVDRSRYEPDRSWSGDKLAWRPVAGAKATVRVPVTVGAGTNRFDLAVEDNNGLRTVETLYILGDGELPEVAAEE